MSSEIRCIVSDIQCLEIVFADDLQNPTVFDEYEDDVSTLVHDLDEARAVAGFCAWRIGFANEIRLVPYVVVFRQDAIQCIAKIENFPGSFLGRLPFDLNLAASCHFFLQRRVSQP